MQHTSVGNVFACSSRDSARMISGSAGGGSGGRWSVASARSQSVQLTLAAERHDACVAVRRGEVRVQADLRCEVVQRDAL